MDPIVKSGFLRVYLVHVSSRSEKHHISPTSEMLLCPHENRSRIAPFSPGESPECHRRGDPNGDSSRAWFSIHIGGPKRNDRSWTRTDVVDLRNEAIWKSGEIRRDPKSMASYWTIIYVFCWTSSPTRYGFFWNISFLPRSHQLRILRYKEHLEKHRKSHHLVACSLGPWVRLHHGRCPISRKAAAAQAATGQTGDPGVGGDSGAGAQRIENGWIAAGFLEDDDGWWLMIDGWWWMIDDWWLMIDD